MRAIFISSTAAIILSFSISACAPTAPQIIRTETYSQGGNYFVQQVEQYGPPPWEREDQTTDMARYEFSMQGRNSVVFSHATVWIETVEGGELIGWYQLVPPEDLSDQDLRAVIRSSIVDEYDRDSMYWPPTGPGICKVWRSNAQDRVVIDLTPPTGFDDDWMVIIPADHSDESPEWTYWSSLGRTLQGSVIVISEPD